MISKNEYSSYASSIKSGKLLLISSVQDYLQHNLKWNAFTFLNCISLPRSCSFVIHICIINMLRSIFGGNLFRT